MKTIHSARLGVAILTFGALFAATPAFAQGGGGGGMPSLKPEEIQKKVNEYLDKCETQTAEYEGYLKLTYKAIPTSPDEIMKTIGDEYRNKIPKGYNIDDFLKAYQPQIQEMLNTYLSEARGWKLEVLQDLKWKSKKIPKGEYKVSLVAEGEALKDLVFVPGEAKPGDKAKKPAGQLAVHFKGAKTNAEPFKTLKFEFKKVEDKKKPDAVSFELWSEFFRTQEKTTDVFKPGEEPKKDTAKKDEPKKDDTKDEKKDDSKGDEKKQPD